MFRGKKYQDAAKQIEKNTQYDAAEGFGLICKTASGVPQRDKVATISKEDVRKIAEQKMPDLNCTDIESAISMIAGTCRSMGVVVGD